MPAKQKVKQPATKTKGTSKKNELALDALLDEETVHITKKISKRPNAQGRISVTRVEVAPGIALSKMGVFNLLMQLEIVKSIPPTARVIRTCKKILTTSTKFEDSAASMRNMKMSREAIQLLSLHAEKKLEDVLRLGLVLTYSQKRRTLSSENVETAWEIMNGKYKHNQIVDFNDIKKRYKAFTDEDSKLDEYVEKSGLRSIDQIYAIMKEASLFDERTSTDYVLLRQHLSDPRVLATIRETGREYVKEMNNRKKEKQEDEEEEE